jgi:hypothetical protein
MKPQSFAHTRPQEITEFPNASALLGEHVAALDFISSRRRLKFDDVLFNHLARLRVLVDILQTHVVCPGALAVERPFVVPLRDQKALVLLLAVMIGMG